MLHPNPDAAAVQDRRVAPEPRKAERRRPAPDRRQVASRLVRILVSTTASVALSFGLGGLVLAEPAGAAPASYVVVSAVNLRSGPGTNYAVIGVLPKGQKLTGTATKSGWIKVTYKGKTGYAYGSYLNLSSTSAARMITTTTVNLRSAPSLSSTVIRMLAKGVIVDATGRTSGDFTEVTVDGKSRWLYSDYLAPAQSETTPLPAVTNTGTATASVAVRTSPAVTAKRLAALKAGATLSLTGTFSASYAQIVHGDRTAWVLAGYVKPTEAEEAFVAAAGKRYVTAGALNIRATSASDGKVVDTAPLGTIVVITGEKANGRSQIIYGGALRWASAKYLSKSRPGSTASLGSASLDRTNANAKVIVGKIRAKFPTITTIYGWRMYSGYSSDHPSGRALDIMMPKYKTAKGRALGNEVARYLQKNHKALRVRYLIWRQRSWNVERSTAPTAWKAMADRGGDTANHMDHVHVTVYDPD